MNKLKTHRKGQLANLEKNLDKLIYALNIQLLNIEVLPKVEAKPKGRKSVYGRKSFGRKSITYPGKRPSALF